jgi:hypothetical protein
MKLRGLVLNFYIHVSVSDLYISRNGPQTQKGGPMVSKVLFLSNFSKYTS